MYTGGMTLSRAAIILALFAAPALGNERDPPFYYGFVERVVDGDSVRVVIPQWPKPVRNTLIRVYGIDAPESKRGAAKCELERLHGLIVKFTVGEMLPKGLRLRLQWMNEREKFNRPLMRIFTPDGKNLGAELLARGLVLEYRGGKKPSHCAGEETTDFFIPAGPPPEPQPDLDKMPQRSRALLILSRRNCPMC
jgi:endonuclease YncB( thermonuclease family)